MYLDSRDPRASFSIFLLEQSVNLYYNTVISDYLLGVNYLTFTIT